MELIKRLITTALMAALAILLTAGCLSNSVMNEASDKVRIGSKDFIEQLILGELYAQLLEHNDIPVERKLNLGSTPVAHESLKNNQIDIYPEYTGTGLLTILKLPAESDRQVVYDTVAKAYREQFNLIWLDPAPMNNTHVFAMTSAAASYHKIETISDLVTQANKLTLIGTPEFAVREDGLPGLKAVYGDFQFKAYKPVDAGLRYQGLINGAADVVVAFGTDGELKAFDLVVLEDDKGFFPPYQVAPVVRQETLESFPQVASVLNQLAPLLTDEVMRQLNAAVSDRQQEPVIVAKTFLQESGLLQQSS